MTNSVSRVPKKGIRAWSTRVLGLASMVSLLACGSQESGPTQSSTDEAKSKAAPHKVQLSAKQVQELAERGANHLVVADYGTFKLVEVDEKTLASLPEGAEVRNDFNEILLNAGTINTASVHGQSLRGMRMHAAGGKRLHMVQFSGPIKPEWYKEMAATGVQVVTYVPNNTYIVYGDGATLGKLQQHIQTKGAEAIQWDGEYLTDFKLHPTVHTAGTETFEIQIIKDEETNAATLDLIRTLQSRNGVIQEALGYVNVVAYVTPQQLNSIAARADVFSIQPYVMPRKFDERQNMIVSGQLTGTQPRGPGWLELLQGWGFTQAQFTASNFAVDVTDSGLDNAIPATPNHFGLYTGGVMGSSSRVVYARLEGSPNGAGSTIMGCDGHGTINSHIVAGYNVLTGAPHEDALGFNYGMGVAPFVKVASSVIFDPGSYTFPDFEDMLSRGYRDSTRISTNSWGAASPAYSSESQRYDALVRDSQPADGAVPNAGNQEMVILFAAGNSGSSAGTVGRPGNAKNVITVGASENVHPFGGADLCGIADSGADSAMDIISFSSRGPTPDGRKKPDIMAPGTHVTGGVAQAEGQRANPPANPMGQALNCFDASGVCAGPGIDFFPAGQQWTTSSSGTSHSTPAVAGGAALVRQYFINQGMPPPSPAMTKAFLMNSTRYMTGAAANDNLWSNNQGMGLMDLGMAFDGTPRTFTDQEASNLFTATGQSRTFTGAAGDPTKPFRVTLAWTDAPGSTTGAAAKNNLDLTVTVGDNTYKGNVFTGANSVTGGNADAMNNVESVFLPAGTQGNFTITVTATNINSDGVPGNSSALDQDFSLVAYNTCGLTPSGPLTDVAAAADGDNRVSISWTNNDATKYNVYRATTAGGPYTRIAQVERSPYVDTTVSGGTTYYYVVRGAICVESPASNEVSVTATGACTLLPTFAGITDVTNDTAATCGTTATWSAGAPACGGTLSYSVYRSTVRGFTPSIANKIATGITGNSFADNLNLISGTRYYYVVRATETAAATVEETNTVEDSAVPTGAVAPGNHTDDLDNTRPPNADAFWVPTTQAGATGTMNLVSGCHYQSATRSWRFGAAGSTACGGTYPNSVQATLVLGGNGTAGPNGFALPASGNASLSFNIWHQFETGWDGAWLVYSTTGANGPWTAIGDTASATAPYISVGGYTGTISGVGNRVWSGASTNANGSLKAVSVNLNALAGQTVHFGFRFRTDGSVVSEGFYVDDIRLDASVAAVCTTNTPPPGPAVAYRIDGLPATAGAGEPVTFGVTALDAVGQTSIDYAGSASFSSSDAQAQLPANATFTAGVASGLSVEFRTLGSRSITATDVANTAIMGSGSTSVTAGPAAGLLFARQPVNTVAGNAITPSVRVGLADRFGNAVTTGTNSITVALGNNPGNGTLTGTATAAAVNGVATFADLSIDKIGAGYTLAASSEGLTGATSAGFAITPAAPAQLEVTTQPSTTVAGESINPAVAVLIKDRFGNPTAVSNEVYVELNPHPSEGSLSGTQVVDAVNGTATFSDLWIDKVGTGYSLLFVSPGGPTGFMTVSSGEFNITPAAPYRAVITREPSDTIVGMAITPAVQVTILDRFDNVATQATRPVSVALGSNPRGAQLRGTTSVNPVSGMATFSDLSVNRAGNNYTLIFGSSGLHSDTSVGFDVAARAQNGLEKLAFRPVTDRSTAGQALGAIEVELQDVDGNLLTGESQIVTLSLGENPTGAQLLGTTTVAAVNGVAKFEGISLQKTGNGYALVARADGFDSATSSAFAVMPGAAASFSVTSPSATTAGEEISISATAHDAYANVAANYGGTVRVTSTDSAATHSANATFVEGKLNNFKVTFKGKGLKTITLTDAANASLTSTMQVNVTPFGQPTATVTSPEGGLMVSGTVNITATGAVAAGNTLAKLQIFVDGKEIANGSNAELSGSWDSANAEPGSHTITATVTDGAGNVVTSAPVVVFKDGGCGCGATSGTDAAIYLGLLMAAWYLGRRREKSAA
jgi:hypothetical protein